MPPHTGHCQEFHYSFCFCTFIGSKWHFQSQVPGSPGSGWSRPPSLGRAPCLLFLRVPPRRLSLHPGSLLWSVRVRKSYFKELCYLQSLARPLPSKELQTARYSYLRFPFPALLSPDAGMPLLPAWPLQRAVSTHHLTHAPIGCCLLLTHVIGAGAPRPRTPPSQTLALQRVPAGHWVLRRPPRGVSLPRGVVANAHKVAVPRCWCPGWGPRKPRRAVDASAVLLQKF